VLVPPVPPSLECRGAAGAYARLRPGHTGPRRSRAGAVRQGAPALGAGLCRTAPGVGGRAAGAAAGWLSPAGQPAGSATAWEVPGALGPDARAAHQLDRLLAPAALAGRRRCLPRGFFLDGAGARSAPRPGDHLLLAGSGPGFLLLPGKAGPVRPGLSVTGGPPPGPARAPPRAGCPGRDRAGWRWGPSMEARQDPTPLPHPPDHRYYAQVKDPLQRRPGPRCPEPARILRQGPITSSLSFAGHAAPPPAVLRPPCMPCYQPVDRRPGPGAAYGSRTHTYGGHPRPSSPPRSSVQPLRPFTRPRADPA